MILGAKVVVVVPAFEEASRIARVIASMPAAVDHVVVVDDASHDHTADAATRAGDVRVEVIVHATNRGVGAAIVTGYQRALALTSSPRDVFVVMAGDGQMHPDDLPAVALPVVRGEADYVKGDRFADDDVARVMPRGRLVGGKVFSWLTSRAIGIPISDSQCGYTALARAACARLDLDDLWPRYGYPNDLLSQLALRNLRIAHARVRPVYADEVSRLRLSHLPRIGQLLARAWLRRMRAR